MVKCIHLKISIVNVPLLFSYVTIVHVKACVNELMNSQNSFDRSELKLVGINRMILTIKTRDSIIWSSSQKNMS